uniref:Uncharacterized protein n=1 Tax=Amphimedon queenslandica TaxID=400682 RepID=A0A1X7V5J7_AMPQE
VDKELASGEYFMKEKERQQRKEENRKKQRVEASKKRKLEREESLKAPAEEPVTKKHKPEKQPEVVVVDVDKIKSQVKENVKKKRVHFKL